MGTYDISCVGRYMPQGGGRVVSSSFLCVYAFKCESVLSVGLGVVVGVVYQETRERLAEARYSSRTGPCGHVDEKKEEKGERGETRRQRGGCVWGV